MPEKLTACSECRFYEHDLNPSTRCDPRVRKRGSKARIGHACLSPELKKFDYLTGKHVPMWYLPCRDVNTGKEACPHFEAKP